MHPGATEAFLKRLLEIVENITIISSSSDMNDLMGHHFVVIEKGIYLVDDNIARFEKLFDLIWDKLHSGEKFSKDAVEKKLKQLVSRIVKEGNTSNAGTYFNQLIEYYETYSIEQIFYVPLVNIEMHSIDKLEIGRVTIKRMTDKEIAGIARKIKKTIMKTEHSPEDKPLIIDTLLKQEVEPLRGQICAEFRIVAEAELVEELARKEVSHILDLLRYAIPNIYPYQYPMYWCPPQDRKRVSQAIKKGDSQRRTRIGLGVQGEENWSISDC